MKVLTWFLVLFGVAVVAGSAAEPQSEREVEVGRNVRIRVFAFGGIGVGGVTSEGEKYFFDVLTSAGANGFCELFERGDAQAKAYALAGLRWLSDSRYEQLRDSFVADGGEVQMAQGCLLAKRDAAEIAALIDHRMWDDYIAEVMKKRGANQSTRPNAHRQSSSAHDSHT